jgi:antitoxin (DNA-binding transcriptional repressor) of toxin-antitoxin stability system
VAQVTLDINELPLRQREIVRDFAQPGDRIIVTDRGEPVFELTPADRSEPATTPLAQRTLGLGGGKTFTMAPDFNDPLPPEVWTDLPK